MSVLALSRPNLPGLGGSISADGSTSFGVSAPDPTGLSSRVDLGSPASGSSSDLSTGLRQPGFTGAIGRPGATGNDEDRRRRRAERGKKPGLTASLTAPSAGFSLGRGPGGVVLERSGVPAIVARPPTVTSSVIGLKPGQIPGGSSPTSTGLSVDGAPSATPAAPPVSAQAPGAVSTVVTGDGTVLAPRMPGASGLMGEGGEGGPGMTPMGGMGGAGRRGIRVRPR